MFQNRKNFNIAYKGHGCFKDRNFQNMYLSDLNFQDRWNMANSPGPKVIKLFSCSTQLSMKFKILINIEIAKLNGNFRFRSQKPAIYPANKC